MHVYCYLIQGNIDEVVIKKNMFSGYIFYFLVMIPFYFYDHSFAGAPYFLHSPDPVVLFNTVVVLYNY